MYLKFRSQNFTIIITWKFGPEWVPKKVGPSLDSGSEMILAQKSVQLPYSFQAHCPEPRASLGCVFTLLPCLFWNLSWIVMDTRTERLLARLGRGDRSPVVVNVLFWVDSQTTLLLRQKLLLTVHLLRFVRCDLESCVFKWRSVSGEAFRAVGMWVSTAFLLRLWVTAWWLKSRSWPGSSSA